MCCCTWQPGTRPKQLLHKSLLSHRFPKWARQPQRRRNMHQIFRPPAVTLSNHVHHAHAFCGLRWADFSVKQGGENKVSRHANGAKHKQAAEAQRGASNLASFLMRVVSEHCGRQCPYFVFALLFFFSHYSASANLIQPLAPNQRI